METTKKLSKSKTLTGMYTKGQIDTANLFGCNPKQVATTLDELENCEYFYGDLTLNGLTNLDSVYTNNLKGINGNLEIINCNMDLIDNLKYVTGNVQIISSKIKYINSLTKVGKQLNITKSILIAMPKLKTIGKNLVIQDSDILNLNELEEIGHNFFLIDSYIGSAKNLHAIHDVCVLEKSKIDVMPNHQILCPNVRIIDENSNVTFSFNNIYQEKQNFEK